MLFSHRDFGVSKFRRLLLAGSFTQVAQFLMGFIGSAIAGNVLGETELAGVSLLLPINSLLSFVATLFGVGMGICYALELGKGNSKRAHEIFSQGLWSALIVGSVLSFAFAFGYPLILDCLGPSASVRTAAEPCFRAFALAPLAELLSIFLLNASFADGDDALCYASYGLQLAINVAVTYLTLTAGMGTCGCAIGMIAGFAVSAAILAIHFAKESNSFRIVSHFRLADTWLIVRTVFGDSSGYLFQAALFFALEKYAIQQFGSELLPILAVVAGTIGLLDLFGGVGAAVQPVASVYIGERNTCATRAIMTDAIRIVIIEAAAMVVLFIAAPRIIIALVGISDPTHIATAIRAVRILSIGFIGFALTNLLNGYYIIIGHGMLSTIFSALGWFVMPMTLVITFGPLGSDGLWFGLGLGPLAAIAIVATYIICTHGRAMCPLLLPSERDAKIFRWTLPLEPEAITETARLVSEQMERCGAGNLKIRTTARLLVEDALLVVKEHNGRKKVLAEATLDLNDGETRLTLRDDGEIFDITDADAQIQSFRAYIVCTVMANQRQKENLITTGFNRNVFRFSDK